VFASLLDDVRLPTVVPDVTADAARHAAAASGLAAEVAAPADLVVLPLEDGGFALAWRLVVSRRAESPAVVFVDAASARVVHWHGEFRLPGVGVAVPDLFGSRDSESIKQVLRDLAQRGAPSAIQRRDRDAVASAIWRALAYLVPSGATLPLVREASIESAWELFGGRGEIASNVARFWNERVPE
jgi:hypothetical protein